MIQTYVDKLFDTLPNNLKNANKPLKIDLILEGGAFNGSYLIGALHFLKKLEKNNIIEIKRISGASIGSFVGLLYFIDKLDVVEELYDILLNDFKKKLHLNIIDIANNNFKSNMPTDTCLKINNKLYIAYNNIKNKQKVIKHKYKNNDDVLDTIIKSCFIPFAINGLPLYKKKYMDGINPHIFKLQKNRKILYLNITTIDRLYNLINVKNETESFHRIMTGLLDIHMFFIKNYKTNMCSYVNEWGIFDVANSIIKKLIEKLIIYIMTLVVYLKYDISNEAKNNFFYKYICKYFKSLYLSALKKYCFNL